MRRKNWLEMHFGMEIAITWFRASRRLIAALSLSGALGFAPSKETSGVLASYSDVIRAGPFYSIFVAIAACSAIGLMAMIPLLKRLAADRGDAV